MKAGNLILVAFLFSLLIGGLYLTFQMPPNINPNVPGAGYVPQLYISIGLILCIIIFINVLREKTSAKFIVDRKLFLYIAVSVLYFISIQLIGYYPSTIATLIVLLLLLGVRNWVLLTSIPVAFSIFIYVVFDYFIGLPLP